MRGDSGLGATARRCRGAFAGEQRWRPWRLGSTIVPMALLPRLVRSWLVLSAVALTLPPAPAQDAALQLRINAAIERGVVYLKQEQHRDGSWTGGRFAGYPAGPTALAAYTLVEAGVSPGDPSIQLALEYLYAHRPKKTYSAGVLLLLLAEIGGDEHLELAQETLDVLLDGENQGLRGAWAYPEGQVDLSNTQFAALGFWSAHRLGLDVPVEPCRRMVLTTAQVHQDEPKPTTREDPSEEGRSRTGRRKMAGFTYLPNRTVPARGTMTVAGICVYRIAQRIHGKKLGRKALKAAEESEPLAMNWLFEFWDPAVSPGMEGKNGLFYYLWGIERLGALLERDQLFGDDWYVAGANVLLGLETGEGSWGAYEETSYTLLFLSRATGRTASSGPKRAASSASGSWTLEQGPVHIAATGGMELVAWITDIDEEVRVERVQWLLDGDVVAEVRGDPSKPWKQERFAMRWNAPISGKHRLVARVHALGEGDRESSPVDSKPLEVECRWSADDWMRDALGARGPNLLAGAEVEFTASTEASGQEAGRAIDGFEGTAWIAGSEDPAPHFILRPLRPIRSEALTLSHPASSVSSLSVSAGATRIRVTVNNEPPFDVELPAQSPGVLVVPFPEKVRVRELRVEILDVAGGPAARRGFAEIGLR